MSYGNYKHGYRNLGSPETIVQDLMTTQFKGRDGILKPMTRYQLAKETGLSWHTINKALESCGAGYSPKTKKSIRSLLQVV